MQTTLPEQKLTKQDNHQRWKHIIADFVTSGLRQREYCRKHDLKPEQLSYYYLKWQGKKQAQEKTSFIPVKIDNKEPQESKFTLTLINGIRLDVPANFSPSSLEKLLILARRI